MDLDMDPTIQNIQIDRGGEKHGAVFQNAWSVQQRRISTRADNNRRVTSRLDRTPPKRAWRKWIFGANASERDGI
jgi:hypothetical protein